MGNIKNETIAFKGKNFVRATILKSKSADELVQGYKDKNIHTDLTEAEVRELWELANAKPVEETPVQEETTAVAETIPAPDATAASAEAKPTKDKKNTDKSSEEKK